MAPVHDHCHDCQEQYTQYHVPVILSCCQNIICRGCAFKKWVRLRRRCWYKDCSNTKILSLRCAGSFTPPYTDVGHLEEGEEGIVLLTLEDLKLRKYQRIGKYVEDVENEGRRQSINKKANHRKKRVHREYLDERNNDTNFFPSYMFTFLKDI